MTNADEQDRREPADPQAQGPSHQRAKAIRPWIVSVTLHTFGLLFLALWVAPVLKGVSIEYLRASIDDREVFIPDFSISEVSEPIVDTNPTALDSPVNLETDFDQPQLSIDAPTLQPIAPVSLASLSPTFEPAQRLSDLIADAGSPLSTGELHRTDGVAGAADLVSQQIRRELALGDTLVVWLLDASISLSENREVLAAKSAELYKSLDSFNTSRDDYAGKHTLMSSVIAFGRRSSEVLPPTRMGAKAVETMTDVPIDTSGIENTMAAVNRTVRLYRQSKRRSERMVLVVLTDESGDDLLQLEPTIESCRENDVVVHVLGPSAVMGCQKGSQLCVLKKNNVSYSFWLTVNKGPETSLPERFLVPYWHESSVPPWRQGAASVGRSEWYGGSYRERVPSGFGPYALTRLALETGGSFTMFERLPMQADYDQERMQNYLPDYRSVQDYLASIEGKPLRQFVADAAATGFEQADAFIAPRMVFMGARSPYYPYDVRQTYYSPADFRDQLQLSLRRQRQQALRASQLLSQFVTHLFDATIDWEYEYAREPSQRWRAWYDLTRGRLLATQARYLEYIAASYEIESQLAPDTNHITLQPSSVLRNSESELLINDAMRCLQRCMSEHKDTPWEDLARWEQQRPCGLTIVPGIIPRPAPRIVTGSPRAPQQFAFPNL